MFCLKMNRKLKPAKKKNPSQEHRCFRSVLLDWHIAGRKANPFFSLSVLQLLVAYFYHLVVALNPEDSVSALQIKHANVGSPISEMPPRLGGSGRDGKHLLLQQGW